MQLQRPPASALAEAATQSAITDVVVIGAGPAGAMTAGEMARLMPGASILLVDSAAWPREKACGCCLSPAAVQILNESGIDLKSTGLAARIQQLVIRHRGRAVSLAYQGGLAIARRDMDAVIVANAIARGVMFVPSTSASVLDHKPGAARVHLRAADREVVWNAGLVVAADGLTGSSLRHLPRFASRVEAAGRIGISVSFACERAPEAMGLTTPGAITMHVGDHGYAGAVCLASGAIHVAAAVSPGWTRSIGGPREAVRSIFGSCGVSFPALLGERLQGTGLLTRRRDCVADEGVLVVGDAAGYVEPFTGEGMAWALASGRAAAAIVADAWSCGTDRGRIAAERWTSWHSSEIVRRQRLCRATQWMTRRPTVLSGFLRAGRSGSLPTRLCTAVVNSTARRYTTPSPRALTGGAA